MSRLMRIAYGHGGTRLERILVAAPPGEPTAAPRWLRLLLLAVWLCVPVLISRYAVPTAPRQTTVIDTSRLELMPPPVSQEPPQVKPAEPPPQPPPEPLQNAQQPLERPQEEAPPPTITRPAAPRAADVTEYQPRIVRERAQVVDAATSAAPRFRRNAATATEVPAEPTPIRRTRGAATADAPAATERVAPLRRARVSDGVPTGSGPELRPIAHRERSAGAMEGSTPRLVATRERTSGAGAKENTGSSSPAHLQGGVSLASLDICASPREEEEKITAVLGAVGSQQSCRNGSGEYRFRGTQRISSFNLMIYPAKGRRPTNRCEELENAYRCLKGL